ncbi:MAG: M48 family metalloprotease, partial [Candidatus Eisenbacteria bacterium]|nr:M48 family metalloprotease [Candidatus Eisenbacteria bacterium]
PSSDFEVGLEAARNIAESIGLVESDSLVQRVNDVGYRVAMAANRPGILFTFQILDMDVPNALALPGGWIFVTRGILDTGIDDDELANLLGHEIGHVTRGHFSRQGRLDGLLSLVQTALVVAVAMLGDNSSSSRPVIESPGDYGYSLSSGEAALAGTNLFGSVFHELLLRGYSRKLEMEADEEGRRLASLSGYPREAGASLLEKLHNQIYEDREYGYWRTHPYFVDRVAIARAASPGASPVPDPAEVSAYRLSIQEGLAAAAARVQDEQTGTYLYELALHAGPNDPSSVSVHTKAIRFRLTRIERKDPLLRAYGPVGAELDSLLGYASSSQGIDPATVRGIRDLRDSVEASRQALLPRYRAALESENANLKVLDAFLRNFPDDESAAGMSLRLARAYRLSRRPDRAIPILWPLTSIQRTGESTDSTIAQQARVEILRSLGDIKDPSTGEDLLARRPDSEIRAAALARMEVLADSAGTLQTIGRFLATHRSSEMAPRFRDRLASLAEAEFKKGRLHESLGDRQAALEEYNRIVLLAPETDWAKEARRGIDRIQALASSKP